MASKDISCLPADLLLVILCRLEAKFLVRCTSVCKPWYHIVKSPSCAKAHLTYQKTSSHANKYILHQDYESCTLLNDIKPLFDGTEHSAIYYTPELFDGGFEVRIHGICDGLLCISFNGQDIFLWNPICRKAKKLPVLKLKEDGDGIDWMVGVSFGYYGNDYKVIVISSVDRKYIVSVYSLSGDCWNVIRTNSYYDHTIENIWNVFCSNQPTKFVDGVAYMILDIFWNKRSSYATPDAILSLTVCFDLRDQTIQQFKCPKEFFQFGKEYTLEVYGETIAALGCDNYSGYLAMWVLFRDKLSSKALWEKKRVIKLDPCFSNPVGFLCADKYMVRTTTYLYDQDDDLGHYTRCFLYDLESKEVTKFSSLDYYPDDRCKIDSNCVESLLLLNEDSVDPFVHKEMESSCSSMLFTLHNHLY